MSEQENYEDDEFISFEEYEALSEEEKAEYEIIQLDEISTKTLARAAHAASDPETFGKYHDPQKFADYAKKTKSAKAAANVQRAASGRGHFAKPNRSFGYDPLKDAKTTRVTKSGTMNKQDAAAKKNEIKNRLGAHTKAKLPEEYDYELDESAASDTLKPGSRSVADPKSKIEAITSVIGAMHSMRKDDLTKWFTQAMALIGKEADSLPSGASADSNASSIDAKTGKGPKTREAMPKLSVKEDVEEMFDGQDLSEEFKDRASTLFEAAVNARIILESSRLEEQYEARLEEEVTEIAEALEKKLDTYLDYVVENWMKENEVAIESSLRNEIMEEFIDGLKGLFAEHYIDVPEEKIDVVEELAAKVDQLETMLDESITENAELKGMVSESTRISVFEEMSEDLTMVQSEKFAALAEGIDFDGDVGSYKKKLSYVKETYFSKKSTPTTNIEEETFEGDTSINESVKSHDPEINRLANAISRTIKK